MRVAHSFLSLLVVGAFGVTACGGSSPPPAAPTDAPMPEATVQPEPPAAPKPAASEDEGWVGEKSAKGGDSASAAPSGSKESAAEPAPADGKAPESRSMDVIRKLVMDNRKAARKCYDDARKDNKDLKGDVVIHFVLDPEGKVKLAELNQERSTLKAPPVVACVIAVIKGISFPKSSRAMETTTNYPFNFTP